MHEYRKWLKGANLPYAYEQMPLCYVLRIPTKYTSIRLEVLSSLQVKSSTNVRLTSYEQPTLTFDLARITCLNLVQFQPCDELCLRSMALIAPLHY
jgi:hypothetical protein